MADKKLRARLAELRSLSEVDLDSVITSAHKNIYQFRKDRLSKPQENVKVIKNNRKEIARVLTIKRQREMAEVKEG